MKKIFPFVLPFIVAACGHHSEPASPPPPCGTGVNAISCTDSVTEPSAWRSESTLTYPAPTGERIFTTTYEFSDNYGEPVWRRTLSVRAGSDVKSMVESGRVVGLTNDQIKLEMNSNTCASEAASLKSQPSSIILYYVRTGDSMSIDFKPIAQVNGVGDLMGEAIKAMFVDPIANALRLAFSFGSARNFMESTAANLKRTDNLKTDALGSLGCFSDLGNGFSQQ